MFIVSHLLLKILAAIVWYIGSVILFFKGKSLVDQASILQPETFLPYFAIVVGLAIGLIKARFMFIKNGKKNLARIYALQKPRLWEFYRWQFFIFLSLMIALGATLSTLAEGNYHFLISVAALDFSLSTALFISGYVYFKPAKITIQSK